jgi:hypothetical protein
MRRVAVGSLFLMLFVTVVAAQEKGVDNQTEKIKDNSTGPASGSNRGGSGNSNGINWGRDRTLTRPLLANPFRFTGRMDVILKAVQDVMAERKMIPDDSTSRPAEGLIISQPYTFSKGAVVSRGELNRYSELPESTTTTWTGGRYTFTVQVIPIDGSHANVSVSAKIEGRTNDVMGTEWLSLRSNGLAEDEFISDLVTKLTGEIPNKNVAP